jgi:CO/xanthine dehydrogenase Mo-binding subunit
MEGDAMRRPGSDGVFIPFEFDEPVDRVGCPAGLTRRGFVQILGAGLLIAVSSPPLAGQQRRGGRGGGMGGSTIKSVSARVHIGKDGSITVMTGKVEAGQGSRTELTQAAAEELRVPVSRIQLLMADTGIVPDDGMTAGSGTTPRSVPAVRQGCAAARQLLVGLAASRWHVEPASLLVQDGKISQAGNAQAIGYAELAETEDGVKAFQQPLPAEITLTPLKEWKVLGTPVARPDREDLVTGRHHFPSDVIRPGMLHAKVLRAPSYNAKLQSIDLEPARAMAGAMALHEVVREGGREVDFVGFAAATTFAAEQALAAASKTAKWETKDHPSSKTLFDYLREHARNGVPTNPFADQVAKAAKSLRQSYHVSYIQHAPMEPRTAVAEWEGDKLTVWMATQNPFGCKTSIAQAMNINAANVRVIVPDFGGGFGGKHTPDAGVEAARLARAAGKPVSLRWTRAEEFTWAYFRPAGVIDIEAGMDASHKITSWHHVNINSGGNAMDTPYRAGSARAQAVQSEPPLRHGSYRGLAATANIFARESFMDELAAEANVDPLEFRLAHLEDGRLRDVLKAAADKFKWGQRVKQKNPTVGVGLACGTEKGSFTAACVEIALDKDKGDIAVRQVCQAYECGTILNPDGLMAQVQGAVIMGLGGALREKIEFENGKVTNASFWQYDVPRMKDVPELDIILLNRPDLPSTGAGETPIVAVAPAVANAVYHATGRRIRQMPIQLSEGTTAARA